MVTFTLTSQDVLNALESRQKVVEGQYLVELWSQGWRPVDETSPDKSSQSKCLACGYVNRATMGSFIQRTWKLESYLRCNDIGLEKRLVN